MENNLKITNIEDLKKYSKGNVVELPAFGEGQPFVARLTRPSLMGMVKAGKIPNSLLASANSLFEKGPGGVMVSNSKMDEEVMAKMFDVMDAICEASFVEPTYDQLREAGIELTDEQYLFVFDYTQNGIKSLESFRK